ncbi:DUF5689 domain-containing protein [Psychroserpens sp.]
MKKLILTLMKTNKIFTLFTIIAMSFAVTSCVQDDDYSVPSSLNDEENELLNELLSGTATEVTFDHVKAMYLVEFDPGDNAAVLIEEDIYIKGYVSSSDQTGNFFKEFYIQNSSSSPTGALKIAINIVDTYNQFNIGREVYVNLNGLYVGEQRIEDGVITIGGGSETDDFGTTVTRLNENQVEGNVLRAPITEVMEPLVITFSQITDNQVGLLVSIENVEFAANLAGEAYFDPIQTFDTQRTLQSCEGATYTEFNLETSSFADFKSLPLPIDNGTITAIVNKTFDGSQLILALNSPDDVNMSNTRCTLLTPIFIEDFQDAQDNSNLNTPGWVNFAEEGGELWTEQFFSGIGTAEFSSFSTGDSSNIGWLVSPGIDMDAQSGEVLSFKTAQHHLDVDSDDNGIKVFVSTDFDGSDVLGATWEEKTANFPNMDNAWYDLIGSGPIDLSSYTGTLHVAFRVTGSGNDSDLDGAFQIDDVAIVAN